MLSRMFNAPLVLRWKYVVLEFGIFHVDRNIRKYARHSLDLAQRTCESLMHRAYENYNKLFVKKKTV